MGGGGGRQPQAHGHLLPLVLPRLQPGHLRRGRATARADAGSSHADMGALPTLCAAGLRLGVRLRRATQLLPRLPVGLLRVRLRLHGAHNAGVRPAVADGRGLL